MPTPTGSRTIGISLDFAVLPDISIEFNRLSEIVPQFKTSPSAICVTSPTSLGSSAIIGDAPIVNVMFAQSVAAM